MLKEKDSLWSKVIKNKYMSSNDNTFDMQVKPNSSSTWSDIMKAYSLLDRGTRARVRNEKGIEF